MRSKEVLRRAAAADHALYARNEEGVLEELGAAAKKDSKLLYRHFRALLDFFRVSMRTAAGSSRPVKSAVSGRTFGRGTVRAMARKPLIRRYAGKAARDVCAG